MARTALIIVDILLEASLWPIFGLTFETISNGTHEKIKAWDKTHTTDQDRVARICIASHSQRNCVNFDRISYCRSCSVAFNVAGQCRIKISKSVRCRNNVYLAIQTGVCDPNIWEPSIAVSRMSIHSDYDDSGK